MTGIGLHLSSDMLFLHISFMYDNLTDCIHLRPSDNQPYCNIQGWKIHDLLCCCKYAKPYCKYCNVEKITKDSNKLESHIREIDTAMQEVESSNQQLVDNMEKVSDIVETMTSCISDSDVVSRKMLSKYDESATNINNIESIIQALTSNFEWSHKIKL